MRPILRSNRMSSGRAFPGFPGCLAPAWTRFLTSVLDAICRSTPVVDATPSVIRHVACCMLHVACRLIELCAESCCPLQAQPWLPNYVLTYARTEASPHFSEAHCGQTRGQDTHPRGTGALCTYSTRSAWKGLDCTHAGPFEACQSFSNSVCQPWSEPSNAWHPATGISCRASSDRLSRLLTPALIHPSAESKPVHRVVGTEP